MIAAQLLATAWAVRHFIGAALTPNALKLSAKQALTLPLPTDQLAWDRAATSLRSTSDIAHPTSDLDMCLAYGLDEPSRGALLTWWRTRLRNTYNSPP